jgi:pimeloyl-ACP methyl ester carboxylesterase
MSLLLVMLGAFLMAPYGEAAGTAYFYPFVNPYEATVIPLPAAYEATIPAEVPTREFTLEVFPERKIPDVFWYQNGLICSLAYQDHKAPLLFLIAGTGSRHNSPTMLKLQRAYYQAGFHVLNITSPTHMNFVVNASSGMPGHVVEDAKDLYRVMEMANTYAREKVEVSGYALAGYSLGGIQAAFVAKLDDERKRFNFDRVLLINPPLNLYTSVSILDRLLMENIPGGPANFSKWFMEIITKLAQTSRGGVEAELTGEFIYKVYKHYPPREDFLAALIGTAFRMDSANMVFTADVMNGGGYIVPKNAELTSTTSLTNYAVVSYRTSFVDYFNEWFLPYYQKKEPGLSRDALIERMGMRSIESYLKNNPRIGLLHNEDDIIMGPGEVEYLRGLFGDRASIFPTGGHLGNLSQPDVVRAMTKFLSGKEVAQ